MIFGRRPSPGDAYPERDSIYQTSVILRMFVDCLENRPAAHVLDVGPICGENISFFAQRVGRLSVCDMFLRLDKVRSEGLPAGQILRQLKYPSQSFDGILLWDLPDRLEDKEVGRLAELCLSMLRPEGVVVIFASGEHAVPGVVDSFVISEDFKFQTRRQPHLSLPIYRRQNRDMLAVVAPFTPVKSFIHRNGLREFLFRKA